jgi:hypothetical protein
LAIIRCAAAAALLVATPAAADAQGPPYTYQTIRYPGSAQTQLYGISNSGLIIGTYTDAAGVTYGFTYQGGTYTPLNFPGASDSYALGINEFGHIVGSHSFTGPNGPWHSFIYKDGTFTEFDFPGWESDSRAINSAGDIVGVYNESGLLPTHGFTRTGEDTYATLDYPGALYTFLWGINNSGLITGSYIANNDPTNAYHGFMYSSGTFTRIDYPGATATKIFGLNNLGDIVGAHSQGSISHAFVFSQARFRSFDMPGAQSSIAKAINDNRQVVGTYYSIDCPFGCGFLAQPTTGSPRCTQTFTMSYTPLTLSLNLNVRTTVALRWEAYAFIGGGTYRLWSVPLAAGTNTGPFSVPLALQPAGNVVALSVLSQTGVGVICADYAAVDTGTP